MSNPEFSIEAITLSSDTKRSVALIALKGINRPVVNYDSDMTYDVICGEGIVEIDFDIIELTQGYRFSVPKGTPYQDQSEAGMQLLAEAYPPFRPESIVYLDEL